MSEVRLLHPGGGGGGGGGGGVLTPNFGIYRSKVKNGGLRIELERENAGLRSELECESGGLRNWL